MEKALAAKPSIPVTIDNPADIAKAEGIQEPYQAQASCLFAPSVLGYCDDSTSIQVPASQRLVIEFVTGICSLNSNINISQATIKTTVGGNSVTHYLAFQPPLGNLIAAISPQ